MDPVQGNHGIPRMTLTSGLAGVARFVLAVGPRGFQLARPGARASVLRWRRIPEAAEGARTQDPSVLGSYLMRIDDGMP
jgi:hypothetical protein